MVKFVIFPRMNSNSKALPFIAASLFFATLSFAVTPSAHASENWFSGFCNYVQHKISTTVLGKQKSVVEEISLLEKFSTQLASARSGRLQKLAKTAGLETSEDAELLDFVRTRLNRGWEKISEATYTKSRYDHLLSLAGLKLRDNYSTPLQEQMTNTRLFVGAILDIVSKDLPAGDLAAKIAPYKAQMGGMFTDGVKKDALVVSTRSGSTSSMGARDPGKQVLGLQDFLEDKVEGFTTLSLGVDDELSRGSSWGGRYSITYYYLIAPVSREQYNAALTKLETELRSRVVDIYANTGSDKLIDSLLDMTLGMKGPANYETMSGSQFNYYRDQYVYEKGLLDSTRAAKKLKLDGKPFYRYSTRNSFQIMAKISDYTAAGVFQYAAKVLPNGKFSVTDIQLFPDDQTFTAEITLH